MDHVTEINDLSYLIYGKECVVISECVDLAAGSADYVLVSV